MAGKRVSHNYVNNKEFYEELVKWRDSGQEKIPDKIALAIMRICENLARSGRFAGYTWRQEMISDAILACIQFCRNFNPEKSQNPFAFYTQIAYNAFVARIKTEKEKLNTHLEYRRQLEILYDIPTETDDDDNSKYNSINARNKSYMDTIAKGPKKAPFYRKGYSKAQREKLEAAKKNRPKTIEDFLMDDGAENGQMEENR